MTNVRQIDDSWSGTNLPIWDILLKYKTSTKQIQSSILRLWVCVCWFTHYIIIIPSAMQLRYREKHISKRFSFCDFSIFCVWNFNWNEHILTVPFKKFQTVSNGIISQLNFSLHFFMRLFLIFTTNGLHSVRSNYYPLFYYSTLFAKGWFIVDRFN